jgi:hypothetical protein
MTITTSYLVRDGGAAVDFVSDRIQTAEAAPVQLTEPSRTIADAFHWTAHRRSVAV